MTVALNLKPCLDLVDIRMREAGVRGPDTREPMQLGIVGVDDTGLPTDRKVINARSFAWPWLNTAWSYKTFNLKQSRIMPDGAWQKQATTTSFGIFGHTVP